ncbi:MAG TPA: hypothetical protein VFQ45_11155 [Longimicrobium sp.]|nr:hypothetical protein [Longimicrobium sp.]
MQTGAEAALPASPEREVPVTPLRPLPIDEVERSTRERLVRRLAADRLRDLRDDGLSTAYMARMYAVDRDTLEEVMGELGLR